MMKMVPPMPHAQAEAALPSEERPPAHADAATTLATGGSSSSVLADTPAGTALLGLVRLMARPALRDLRRRVGLAHLWPLLALVVAGIVVATLLAWVR